MYYDFSVEGDKIKKTGNSTEAMSGSVNYYVCRFDFSEEWSDFTKFAVFIQGGKEYTLLIQEDACLIPSEFLEQRGSVAVGIYGTWQQGDKPVRISTDFAHIIIEEGAYRKSTAPKVPAPELWEQYLKYVEENAYNGTNRAIEELYGNIDAVLDLIIEQQEEIIKAQNALIGGETA